MDTKQVPFAAHNGIQITAGKTVALPEQPHLMNHLSGVHAGAQFLLAESASGYYLLTAFPPFSNRLIPLLRQSTIQYCRQASGTLSSRIVVEDAVVTKFTRALEQRGRAVIEVGVEVVNEADEVTCVASFRWFVQLQSDQ